MAPELPRESDAQKARERLHAVIAQHDPCAEQRRASLRAAAAELEPLVRRFRMEKWNALAIRWLRLTERLDAEPVALQRKLLQRSAAKAFAPESDVEQDLIRDAMFWEKPRQGEKTEAGLFVLPKDAQDSRVLGLSAPEVGDGEISVEIQMPKPPAMAGILFGRTGEFHYYILDLLTYETPRHLAVLHLYHNGELQKLTACTVDGRSEEVTGWLRLGVRVEGKQVSLQLKGRTIGTHEMPEAVRGKFGLYVSAATASREPVGFRRLRFRPLAELDEAVPWNPTDAQLDAAAIRKVQRALPLLAELSSKRDEAVLLRLFDAERELLRVGFGDELFALLERLSELTDGCLGPANEYAARRRSAAAHVLDAALLYRRANWMDASWDLFDVACFLDAPLAAERLAAWEAGKDGR